MIIIVRSILISYMNFLSTLVLNYICYVQLLYVTPYNNNNLLNICYQIFPYKYNRFFHFNIIPAALLLIASFFNQLYLLRAVLKTHETFSCNLYLYIHHAFFYVFKWWYCRHWKTWWNIFSYFCCEWTFRIIFIFIDLLY